MATATGGAQKPRPKAAGGKDPLLALLYGESDGGKSVSLAGAFPRGYFVGPRGGPTRSAQSVYGFKPFAHSISDLDALERALEKAANKGFDALVADDASLIADAAFRAAEADAPVSRNSGNADGFYAYDYVTDRLFTIRDRALQYPVHLFIITHPKQAWTDKKTHIYYKGTCEFPGKKASLAFPPACDAVYRIEKCAAYGLGPGLMSPWSARIRRDPADTLWFTKCRDDSPDMLPLNMGELLRANGYVIRRAPGLEWMDALVEAGAQAYYSTEDQTEAIAQWLLQQVANQFQQGNRPPWLAPGPLEDRKIARWVIHDVVSRVLIRQAKADFTEQFALPEAEGT